MKNALPILLWLVLCPVIGQGAVLVNGVDQSGGDPHFVALPSCAGITDGVCYNLTDNVLYQWNGLAVVPFTGVGDNLGTSTYETVRALWGSGTGFLMTDGTIKAESAISITTDQITDLPTYLDYADIVALWGDGTGLLKTDGTVDVSAYLTIEIDPTVDTSAEIQAIIGASVYQAYDADLSTYAGIPPSANVQTLLSSATFADMTGLPYQASSATLTSLAGLTETAGGIPYGTADNTYGWLAAGATTEILVGGGAVAPVWTTATGSGAPVRATSPSITTPTITGLPIFGNGAISSGYIALSEDSDNGVNKGILHGAENALNADYDTYFQAVSGTLALIEGNVYSGVHDFGGVTTLEIANSTADTALTAAGMVNLNTTDEQLSFHSAADGEINGEAALSLLYHKTWSFDPKAVCDGAVDRLFLMTVGDDAPEGIKITEWKVSYEANPTTEADLDLKYADAYIGVANAAVIDVLDTTDGVSTEDTNANINSGAAIANGKVLYLEFGTAYTETTHQIIFEMWYYAEED